MSEISPNVVNAVNDHINLGINSKDIADVFPNIGLTFDVKRKTNELFINGVEVELVLGDQEIIKDTGLRSTLVSNVMKQTGLSIFAVMILFTHYYKHEKLWRDFFDARKSGDSNAINKSFTALSDTFLEK